MNDFEVMKKKCEAIFALTTQCAKAVASCENTEDLGYRVVIRLVLVLQAGDCRSIAGDATSLHFKNYIKILQKS